jgi:predicted outer membrane repeat protein
MIGNTYNSATQMAGNVASFNANMIDTRYNSFMNNQAALQGAGIQAGASRDAGMMGMFGQLGGGAMAAGGSIGGAMILGGAI